MLFCQKEAFSSIKTTFYYSQKKKILKRVNPWLSSKFPNIFLAYFSVEETLILSFDYVVFSKGGFLVHKNDILL